MERSAGAPALRGASLLQRASEAYLSRVSPRTEHACAAALALATAHVALGRAASEVYAQREVEAKSAASGEHAQRLPSAGRAQDHPLATWLLHNGVVWGLCELKERLVGTLQSGDSAAKLFLKLMAASVIQVDGCVFVCHLLISRLYRHTPYFTDKRPRQTWQEVAKDYASCNLVVNVVAAVLQVALFRVMRSKPSEAAAAAAAAAEGFRPMRFLARLAWMRLCTDAVFWAGHWVLHTKPVYWAHKVHHEHAHTKITTNFHFSWYDLLIEGFLPVFVGLMSYELALGPIAEKETQLLSTYILMHDVLSHAGKPVPIMNVLPPLAPWLQKWDDRNVWAHEVHHRTLKSNLSISWWFDKMVGTDRW